MAEYSFRGEKEMRKLLVIIILSMVLILSGCIRTKIIDDIQLVLMNGYDWDPVNDSYIGTAVIPLYGNSEESNLQDDVIYHAESNTSQNIRNKIQTKTPYRIETGKLLGILIGEELAKKGLEEITLGISENQDIGRGLYLAVVKGESSELLSQDYKVEKNLPRYINELIESNMERNFPRTNLHQYFYSYYGEGMDPFLPLLAHTKTEVYLEGLALLDGDKYVDSISFDELFIFKMLFEPNDSASYQFNWKDKDTFVVVSAISSTVDRELTSKEKINFKIDIKGTVTESADVKIDSFEVKGELEKAIAEDLTKKAEDLIARLQKENIDPLRIGAFHKSQTRDWKKKEWDELYPTMNIETELEFKIDQSNITE